MKQLFKAAKAYRLVDANIDLDLLTDSPVKELAPGQVSQIGWVNPMSRDNTDQAFWAIGSNNNYTIIAMLKTEKKLKPAAINREVDKRVKLLEKQEAREVGRKERLGIKEEVVFDNLPKAMAEESVLHAYFDWVKNIMVIDSASDNKCDEFTAALREALGSLQVVPLAPAMMPEQVMLAWLNDNSCPGNIAINGDAVFKNPVDLSQTASVKHVDIEGGSVGGILEEGMVPQELALTWALSETSSLDFTVTDTCNMKKIAFSDELINSDDDYDDAEQAYNASMLINCSTVSHVLLKCFELFGGLTE